MSVDIPLGVLCVVTGVAGSGKSSLIHGSMPKGAGVVSIDQTPIRGSRRSNPATYTGLLDPIRTAFAKANGVKAGAVQRQLGGRLPDCNGNGVIYTELGIMAAVATVCEECEGKRFQAACWSTSSPAGTSARCSPCRSPRRRRSSAAAKRRSRPHTPILGRMADVGLGYLTLGQPLTTLSGGERQRLKLAIQMATEGGIYVLDEPTSGPAPRRRRAAARSCSTGWSTRASR